MKVIFLDIDGVLQPGHYQRRFQHNLDKLKEELAEKYNDPSYLKLDKYDVGAVYYDWHPVAVKCLKELLEKTGAKIVISSSWRRSKTLEELKKLFKIHDLDEYIIDTTEYKPELGEKRSREIRNYLIEHPEIKNYIIIDDEKFSGYEEFGEKYIYSFAYFKEDELNKALEILMKD